MKTNYVHTTLEQYLNESKTITLKRGYGERKPVVVGSNAPIRNQILAYVAESQKVSRMDLKRFIAGLNEGSKNPNASAIMWLKRNSQFFIAETKNGQDYVRLSDVGIRLTNRFASAPLMEKEKEEKGDYDFIDTKKGYPRKGITDDEKEEKEDDSKEVSESKELDESSKKRIKSIIENMKARRAKALNEEEKESKKAGEEADELSFDDLDLSGEDDKEEGDKGGEEGDEEISLGDDEEKIEGDETSDDEEKVEITEFIITVDNAEQAIKELDDLGIPAEKVEDEGSEEAEETEEGEEKEEGKIEEAEETEEGKDLELGGDDKEEKEETSGEEKIRVSVDHWEALKGWLEGKGVDVEDMFGGEIEVEETPEDEEDKAEEDELDLDLGGEEGSDLEGGEEGSDLEGDDLSLDDIEEGTEGQGMTDNFDGVENEPEQTLADKIADKVAQKILDKL